MNTLDQLVYCSRSRLSPDIEAAAIAGIVHVAAFMNARNGITGALALQDGVFVQFLEGAPGALDILMLHLHFDQQHEDIQIIARGRIERRYFANWGMTSPPPGRSSELGRLILERPDDLVAWRSAMVSMLALTAN